MIPPSTVNKDEKLPLEPVRAPDTPNVPPTLVFQYFLRQ